MNISARNRKVIALAPVLIILLILVYVMINNRIGLSVPLFDENKEKFTLQPGDILVRPNLNWMPGSSKVSSGKNFGHVAVVVQGAEGQTPEETLQKAMVVEAFIFDQATRHFVFTPEKQVRKAPAVVSFGKRFEGIRYRLRMDLNEPAQEQLVQFLYAQVGKSGYRLFSIKINTALQRTPAGTLTQPHDKWNCATLAWFSILQVNGTNIDFNRGYLVYPNDLIRSPLFDSPGGRIRF